MSVSLSNNKFNSSFIFCRRHVYSRESLYCSEKTPAFPVTSEFSFLLPAYKLDSARFEQVYENHGLEFWKRVTTIRPSRRVAKNILTAPTSKNRFPSVPHCARFCHCLSFSTTWQVKADGATNSFNLNLLNLKNWRKSWSKSKNFLFLFYTQIMYIFLIRIVTCNHYFFIILKSRNCFCKFEVLGYFLWCRQELCGSTFFCLRNRILLGSIVWKIKKLRSITFEFKNIVYITKLFLFFFQRTLQVLWRLKHQLFGNVNSLLELAYFSSEKTCPYKQNSLLKEMFSVEYIVQSFLKFDFLPPQLLFYFPSTLLLNQTKTMKNNSLF